MEKYITADRIANAICQDVQFKGCSVLVEGKKDRKLYGKFINNESARIVETFGKYTQRDAYKILSDRGFVRKIGIRDADFLRIPGNVKFDPNYADEIFPTDFHDSEIMAISYGALSKFISIILDEESVLRFEMKLGLKFQDVIFNLAYHLGCLKLADKKHGLGLSFKPEKVDGNRLKLHKFICFKSANFLGNELMVNTVFEYSKNRGKIVKQRQEIAEKLDMILKNKLPLLEIVNGHDVCEIILMLSKDGLQSSNKILQTPDCVEDMLRLAFDKSDFAKTNLVALLQQWQSKTGMKIFRD